MKLQVEPSHYDFNRYVSNKRWNSYYYQIAEITKLKVKSILLIGVGDGIVVNVLRGLGYDVTTFDFDDNLKPDIVGSVCDIDTLINKKYDCILCCQVLEHLPFDKFEEIIKKFSNIAKENVIISLPYNRIKIFVSKIYTPIIHDISFKVLVPKFWQLKYRMEKEGWGEHYYEVGIKSVSKKKIRKILNEYFDLINEYIPIENVYHRFYILGVKK